MEREKIFETIKNLRKRNIKGLYFESLDEAKCEILKLIRHTESVGIGNSLTLKSMGISSELESRGNDVYDKTRAANKEEARLLKSKAMFSDWYLLSCNAISVTGKLVNIDHSGNRVAAMIYGPKRVIVVASVNKIEETLEAAIYRTKNTAAPENARRAGLNPPCVSLNRCVDCYSEQRACNSLVIIEGQIDPERLIVFLVGEEAGY